MTLASCGKGIIQLQQEQNLHMDNFYARGSKSIGVSVQAKVNLIHKVWLDAGHMEHMTPEQKLQYIDEQVHSQIMHLFGAFKMYFYKGVPKLGNGQKLDYLGSVYNEQTNEHILTYQYLGYAQVDEQYEGVVKLPLPRRPDSIYKKGKRGLSKNPCTDKHYNSKGDHWYFWNLFNYGCFLQAGVDYDLADVEFTHMPSTMSTYPEYDRLLQTSSDSDLKELPIYIFFGTAKPKSSVPIDLKGVKYLEDNYKKLKVFLKNKGFTQTSKIQYGVTSTLHTYQRLMPQSGVVAVIKVFFGNTGIVETAVADFHKLFKEALEKSSVMYYVGHSGLGGNLDLTSIEANVGKITPPKDQYQIYFFDSCSSYPYYTQMYFDKKVGAITKDGTVDTSGTYNLDIVTNGLETYFVRASNDFESFVSSILDVYEKQVYKSWQEIVDDLHFVSLKKASIMGGQMLAINGDEDNPTTIPYVEYDEKNLFPQKITFAASFKNNQIRNFIVNNDNEAFRKKLDDIYHDGEQVYILSDEGVVYYKDKLHPRWTTSSVNNNKTGEYVYLSYVFNGDKAVLYLVSSDNTVYYKINGSAVKLSARQHPSKKKWLLLGEDDQNNTFGQDSDGDYFQWKPSPASNGSKQYMWLPSVAKKAIYTTTIN